MEEFVELFLNFAKGKRQLIPPKKKYDEMVATRNSAKINNR